MTDRDDSPVSEFRASQLDSEQAAALMEQTDIFTESSVFDKEEDLQMLRDGNYEAYMQKLPQYNYESHYKNMDNNNGDNNRYLLVKLNKDL